MTLDDLMVHSRGLGNSSQVRAQKIRFLLARHGRAPCAALEAELLGHRSLGSEQDKEALAAHSRALADDIEVAARSIEQGVGPERALELLDHIFWWVAAAEVALALQLGPRSALDAMSEAICASRAVSGEVRPWD